MGRYRIAASEWIDGDDECDNISEEDHSMVLSNQRFAQYSSDQRHAIPSSPRQSINSIQNDRYFAYRSNEDGSVTFTLQPSEMWIDSNAHRSKRTRGTQRRWYIGSTIVAVIAYLCYHSNHLPPAPPPSAVFFRNTTHVPPTWAAFVHDHTWQWLDATLALCVQTPYAILKYWTMNVVTDVQLHSQRWWWLARHSRYPTWLLQWSQHSVRPSCQWHIPLPQKKDNPEVWITTMREANASIVGQEIAVEWMANAMHAWQQRKATASTDENPLVILATGYPHTGKRTLAYRIMASALRAGSSCHSDPKEQLLHLPGRDWALQDYERDDDSHPSTRRICRRRYQQLTSVIESHIYRRQSLAVDDTFIIFISNIEEMEPCILELLLKHLQTKDTPLKAIPKSVNDAEDQYEIPVSDSSSNLLDLCRNSIIYLTSNTMGMSSLARFLRHGDRNHPLGLAVDLRDAVQRELPDPTLATVVDAILPFLPFTPEALGQLFRHRLLDYWLTHVNLATPIQLVVTDAAVSAVLNDNVVEYVQMGRLSETTKLAVDGAQALPEHPFWNHWYAELHQVVELLESPKLQSTAVLVLDYDPSTILPAIVMDRGVWRFCEGGDSSHRPRGGDDNCVVLRRVRM